jgi:hypothetical protein
VGCTSFGEDEPTERERRHFQAREVSVFACVLDFDSDDVLVCIEVKHDSRGRLFRLYADSVGELKRRSRKALCPVSPTTPS